MSVALELKTRLTQLWRLVRLTVATTMQRDVSLVAAGLAFFALISMAPFVTIAVAIGGAVFGTDAAKAEIRDRLSQEVGPRVADLVVQMAEGARDFTSISIATVISALLLFWGSSRLFVELRRALHRVWDIQALEEVTFRSAILAFLRGRLVAALGVVVFGAVFVGLLATRVALNLVGDVIGKISIFDLGLPLVSIFEFLLAFSVVTCLIVLVYTLLPQKKPRARYIWLGAAITAALLLVGRWLVAAYVATGAVDSAYGAAGALVIFLIWAYYSSIAFLFGARMTHLVEIGAHRAAVQPELEIPD
ncbi:MAG: YihY/virulence factor BrkB family protein [Myxococcales bacterium]|nr:YihY/virulence factor BrkB family protein [Myxococcales bacterium]MCB9731868.1 YihY/virulence factor BrkB family protein [Deltaproteobacteria bacterium]